MTEPIDPEKIIFKDWKFTKIEDTDGVTSHRAEYYFEDENGNKIRGSSPYYAEGVSDFNCLSEDASRIARELRDGKTWDEVADTFREAW